MVFENMCGGSDPRLNGENLLLFLGVLSFCRSFVAAAAFFKKKQFPADAESKSENCVGVERQH
jgi:hypothetical protein